MRKFSFLHRPLAVIGLAICLAWSLTYWITSPVWAVPAKNKKTAQTPKAKKPGVTRKKKKAAPKVTPPANVDENPAPASAPNPVIAKAEPAKAEPKAAPTPTPKSEAKPEAKEATTLAESTKKPDAAKELSEEDREIFRRLADLEASIARMPKAEDYQALKAQLESLATEKATAEKDTKLDATWMATWSVESQPNLERAWYAACYTQKDRIACVNFSFLLIRNFPDTAYCRNARNELANYAISRQWEEFDTALKAFYSKGPEIKALEQLFVKGTPLRFMPYVTAQMALAGAAMGLADDSDRVMDVVKPYVERALQMYTPTEAPSGSGADAATWAHFRKTVLAQGNQFIGYYALKKQHDHETALHHLALAIAVKGEGSQGWKDPLNYYLRTDANGELKTKVYRQYSALSVDQQKSEAGQALYAQVMKYNQNQVEDFARILALKDLPEHRGYRDYAQSMLATLLSQRPDPAAAMQELIKRFQAEFAA